MNLDQTDPIWVHIVCNNGYQTSKADELTDYNCCKTDNRTNTSGESKLYGKKYESDITPANRYKSILQAFYNYPAPIQGITVFKFFHLGRYIIRYTVGNLVLG